MKKSSFLGINQTSKNSYFYLILAEARSDVLLVTQLFIYTTHNEISFVVSTVVCWLRLTTSCTPYSTNDRNDKNVVMFVKSFRLDTNLFLRRSVPPW